MKAQLNPGYFHKHQDFGTFKSQLVEIEKEMPKEMSLEEAFKRFN